MKITRFLSDEPIELDITPASGLRTLRLLQDGASVLEALDKLARFTTDCGPPSVAWLLSQTTGVRVDVRKPNLRLYFLRAEGDTDEQIETARKALVNELERGGCE